MNASKSSVKRHEGCSRSPSSGKELSEVFVKRRKVSRALGTFRNLVDKLMHQYKVYEPENPRAKNKALMEAAMTMRREHQWENTQKCVGHILGIDVGDIFQYWVELNVIGLHRQFWHGIDYKIMDNSLFATSIVVTDRYDNTRRSNGTLVYEGEGGNPAVGKNVSLRDQTLEGGNLALKNSMQARSPVRVIFKVCGKFDGAFGYSNNNSHYSYVYDGLYLVDTMNIERGRYGKLVFKFGLNRILGQPETCVSLKDHGENSRQLANFGPRKKLKPKVCVAEKEVVRVKDLSNGREKFTIRVVAPIDYVQLPTSFDYVVSNIYSQKFEQTILCGCDCADGCVDKENCVCFRKKKGSKMPNGSNKRLASEMESSLIYECGPYCKCSSSCINRVTQNGIQFQLEIFRTVEKGWGVRTRSFIPSGSFVCEYIGEVSDYMEARWRLDNDYIFHMGVGKVFINASKCGNVGRFINHSCAPNLCIKDVMYDRSDKNLPHKMLFALKDIPAGRELTYDYNSFNGKFIKCRSNSCCCGTPECNGQIYI
ncbi:histone-lysine N-methyltransferase, H3 lysine-9 specific SUVH5-like [Vigna radiata var. radiata]|uniref:Histone-lysine N-methyltransferase, H3 lysine-9 specific SUVH5-like n=1 Tax=Vigna radiata var. radiata TaxID=3916 RepID=A0A1S3UZD8_VIGRR|nr:histone-lysine N-methyltransferase, H3 lysine-9 specific SUVH5-like [Vigna radiata var. radiata]